MTFIPAVIASLAIAATAKAEEAENVAQFGQDYQDYMRRTRRFWPEAAARLELYSGAGNDPKRSFTVRGREASPEGSIEMTGNDSFRPIQSTRS